MDHVTLKVVNNLLPASSPVQYSFVTHLVSKVLIQLPLAAAFIITMVGFSRHLNFDQMMAKVNLSEGLEMVNTWQLLVALQFALSVKKPFKSTLLLIETFCCSFLSYFAHEKVLPPQVD